MPTIAIANQKGGVGKTTVAFNLAKGLAGHGYNTLVIDNDPQGNLTSAFLEDRGTVTSNVLDLYDTEQPDITPQHIQDNLDLIGANIHLSKVAERDFNVIFRLDEGLEAIEGRYDFILIDCLPSFGHLNMAALIAADYVIIPTKPSPFAIEGLRDIFDTIAGVQKRLNHDLQLLGLVLNLVERTIIGRELEEAIRETQGDLVFQTAIHKATKLEASPASNQSIMEYEPQGKPAGQFHAFVDEFLERIGVQTHGTTEKRKLQA